MKKSLYLFIIQFLLFIAVCIGQDKSGNTIIFGGGGVYARFSDTSRPFTNRYFTPPVGYNFTRATSNICDSVSGDMLFMCNGMILYDTLGNIIDNGDSLQPKKIYDFYCCPSNDIYPQGTLILPKGSNGKYYLFTRTTTDSTYIKNQGSPIFYPYDLLQYHIIDMNENAGMGKVVQKNIPLLTNKGISRVGMMACKHANGYDWWLLKQAFDTNMAYTFLVTKDTVVLDTIQKFSFPNFGVLDSYGQSCFNSNGSKYAFGMGGVNSNGGKVVIEDFDRCHGILSNVKTITPPYDSTLSPAFDLVFGPYGDSAITGLCFSPNDSFLYVARRYNIYQYDLYEPDSALAWKLIQHGPDTTYQEFSTYDIMLLGIDHRIYIGKYDGYGNQLSVIDSPNKKGVACDVCKKCLRYDAGPYASAPSNMPNFNMPKKEPCWPLAISQYENKPIRQLEVWPNPSHTKFQIKCKTPSATGETKKEFYNSVGQLVISTKENEIDVSGFAKGVYYLKVENEVRKIIIE